MNCPRCGGSTIGDLYGPCGECRTALIAIYEGRNRVRIASLAHLLPEHFNDWMRTPSDDLGGETPWGRIEADDTDSVVACVKKLKRLKVET